MMLMRMKMSVTTARSNFMTAVCTFACPDKVLSDYCREAA